MKVMVKKTVLIFGIFILGVLTSSLYIKSSKLSLNDPLLKEQLAGVIEETKSELEALQIENDKLSLANIKLLQQIELQNKEIPEENHTKQASAALNEESQVNEKPSFFRNVLTPELLKSTAGIQLTPVKTELKFELDLSEEQFEELSTLLKEKVESDIDASAPLLEKMSNRGALKKMMKDAMEGKQSNEDYMTDINQHLDANQKVYEEKISKILSTSQIEGYRAYEIKKQQQQYKMRMSIQSSMSMNNISNLQDYQRDEINRFFKEQQSNEPDAKIGTSGSSFAQNRGGPTNNVQAEFEQLLQQILSSEQFQHYKKAQKNMLSGMFEG